MRIVGIIGKIASGKDFTAGLIKEISPYPMLYLSYSLKLSELFAVLHFPRHERDPKQGFAILLEQFFAQYGHSFTDALFGDIQSTKDVFIVVTGIRYPHQLTRWQELVPNFTSVYLEATDERRWELNNIRRDRHNQPPIGFDAFMQEHTADTEQHIEEMKDMATIVINNDGGFESFTWEIGRLVDTILLKQKAQST